MTRASVRRLLDAMRTRPVDGTAVILLITGYLALTQNTELWQLTFASVPQPLDASGAMLVVTLGTILIAGTFTVSALLCAGPLLRIGLVLILVVAVACNHFMSHYGVLIDTQMLVNASSTNLREAGELITAGLLVRLLIYAGLPALLLFVIRVRPRRAGPELARRLMVAALLWAVAAGVLFANYKEAALWARAHAEVCKYPNPVYPLISAYKLARGSLIAPAAAAELRRVTQRVSLRSDQRRRRVVVLVVGETARADHFSLYGYARDTNPQLAQISSLLRFANVQACGTSTAVSVPCMFSRLDREQFDRDEAQGSENLLDVLMRAGVSVLWRENNTGCQGVCSRVLTEDLSGLDDPRFCTNGTCRDEVLLTGLRERLSAAGDQLIVLHQLGSHGPSYYKRYPRGYTRFQPECALDEAYRCERKALVNTYDNTVLYTDHVLAEVIRTLETLGDAVDAAMLYVSDHGESLGEHGLYLHGFPYALAPVAQTRVPMLAWLSPSLIRQLGVSRECLDAQTQRSLSHDHLFDIVLGLYGIDTDVYRPAADIIVSCRSAQ